MAVDGARGPGGGQTSLSAQQKGMEGKKSKKRREEGKKSLAPDNESKQKFCTNSFVII